MQLRLLPLAAVTATLGVALWTTAAMPGESTAVDYKFREAPLNGLGLQNLEELRGKPIVIDFWGKN